MSGKLIWNDRALLEVRDAAAETLLRAAVAYQAELMKRLGTHYPPASRPGEYPHKRTGHGQAGLRYEPATVAAVSRSLRVKVGFTQNVFYMPLLELKHRRKGLLALLDEMRPRLLALMAGK